MLDRNPSSREVWTQTWLELTPTFADDADQFWHPINQLKCSLENAIVLISRHKKVFSLVVRHVKWPRKVTKCSSVHCKKYAKIVISSIKETTVKVRI